MARATWRIRSLTRWQLCMPLPGRTACYHGIARVIFANAEIAATGYATGGPGATASMR